MYSIGPNIVLEEIVIADINKQILIKADPTEYSSSPQVSCLTVDSTNQLLAVSTE